MAIDPGADGVHRPGAERHDAFFVPFAVTGAEAFGEMDIGDLQRRNLRSPAAGGVEQLEEGLVPLARRRPAVGAGEEAIDLLGRHGTGHSVVAARGGEELGRALLNGPFELEEGKEDPQGRRLPGHARPGQPLLREIAEVVAEIADRDRSGVSPSEPNAEVAEIAGVSLERVVGEAALVAHVGQESLHEEGVRGRASLHGGADIEDHAPSALALHDHRQRGRGLGECRRHRAARGN